ncbi:MAG: hypothetical protein R3326_05245 [Gemmatimonadota bacterium]|nr:hypothetical protein [Gemmatimonadota bacterium]
MERRPIRWHDPGPGTRVALLVVAYLALVWLSFEHGPYATLEGLVETLPEETFGWGERGLDARLEVLGEAGRDAYWQFQIADFLAAGFAAIVLMAVIQWGAHTFGGEDSALHHLSTLPLLLFLAEVVENVGLVFLSVSWPDLPGSIVSLASWATRAKFVLGGATFVGAAVATLAGWWALWITRG